MAEIALRHRTFYEGDDDGSILRALAANGLLPTDLEVVPRGHRKNTGKDGMLIEIAALINPAGGAGRSAVAVHDMDDLGPPENEKWLLQRFGDLLLGRGSPIQLECVREDSLGIVDLRLRVAGEKHVGRLITVAVGLPAAIPAEFEIGQFAIDDYILLMAWEKAVYEAVSEFKTEGVAHELALRKLSEVVALMKNNGVPIRHTKRLMHIFRAVTGYRAAPATFAERMISSGISVLGKDRIAEIFGPLLAGLKRASELLGTPT